MKIAVLLCVCATSLAVSGCESLSEATAGMREKIAARNEPRTKVFAAPSRVVFEAVKAAANSMGYRMTRGGPAQGEYEGVSAIGSSDSGAARQVGIKVRIREAVDGTGSNVSVWFTEILESGGSHGRGIGTETTMRDTPRYEVYFRNVQQALGGRPTAAPVAP